MRLQDTQLHTKKHTSTQSGGEYQHREHMDVKRREREYVNFVGFGVGGFLMHG